MSVINSMLRDLDRRHAPSPFKGNVSINANAQPAFEQSNRMVPRSAIALCVLIVLVILSWEQHLKEYPDKNSSTPITANRAAPSEARTPDAQPEKLEKTSSEAIAVSEPANRRLTESFATTRREYIPIGSEAASMPPTVTANDPVNRLASQKNPSEEKHTSQQQIAKDSDPQKIGVISETKTPAPIVKQERKPDIDLNAERYQLARNALAQNQPQRAYELLRDNPPSLASNTDYHAVLAAVEQQLGHFSDASLHYQQLLTVDQNQSSWWLGLALSLEGEHRNNEALAAYQRATQLNSLPEAARQYAAARIVALNHSAER